MSENENDENHSIIPDVNTKKSRSIHKSQKNMEQNDNCFVNNTDNKKERDPICGMLVDPKTADSYFEYDGLSYYFCCGGCKEKFEAEPAAYI